MLALLYKMEIIQINLLFNFVLLITVVDSMLDDYNDYFERNRLPDKPARRSVDSEDTIWRITRLKESDFSDLGTRKSSCKDEPFQEKVKKYFKNLANDASLVQFVQAETLPVSKDDLQDGCKAEDSGKQKKEGLKAKLKHTTSEQSKQVFKPVKAAATKATAAQANVTASANVTAPGQTKKKSNTTSKVPLKEKPAIKHAATTHKMRSETESTGNNTNDDNLRRGDYLFSSIEYYDDVIEFDASKCPDALIDIQLEEEIIRNYDVECYLTVEWKSLDDVLYI